MDEGRYDVILAAHDMEATQEAVYNLAMVEHSSNHTLEVSQNTTFSSDLIEDASIRYTLVILHVLAIVLAAIGNGTLIYFILKNRKLCTNVTAYLVLNLAVCDLITTCIHQPMRLADILMPFVSPEASGNITMRYCQVKEFMAAFFTGVAFHTIVAISQERHLLVCYPLRARGWLTISRIKALLVVIWLVSFIALLPAYICYTFIADIPLRDANVKFCMIDIVLTHRNASLSYFLFLFCLYFIAPTLTISVTYGRIFYVLSRRLGMAEIKDPRFAKIMAARKRLAKLMLCIAVVFIVFHAPFFVTYLLMIQGYGIPDNPIFVLLIIEFMGSLNSVFNPFIYSANSKTLFKKKMVSFLGGQDTDSQTLRHEGGGVRADYGTAEVTTTTSTPSRHCSFPSKTSRPVTTPTRHYQTIVTLNQQTKDGINV